MSCPYPDELLEKWDSVCNPIGDACSDCGDYNCEHNLNYNPDEPCCHHVWDYMDTCIYCGFKKPEGEVNSNENRS